MRDAAKRSNWQLLVATSILLRTVHLYAQAAARRSTPSSLILVFLLLLFVIILLWRASRRRKRQQPKGQKSESEQNQVPVTGFDPTSLTKKSAGSIFISYRRQDSQHITGRIYDRLSTHFGKTSVFKDVDAIPLGVDFREHIQEKIGQCAVLVAVIGKSWNQTSTSGSERLSDPRDHLRIEIESALERRIPVIPVLVDGAAMPDEKDLPPSLARLAYYNGISVRPDPDFHHDADRLLRGIESLLQH